MVKIGPRRVKMCVPQIYCNNESYYRTKGGMEGGARSNSGNRIRWTLLPRRGRVRADDEKMKPGGEAAGDATLS